MIARSLTQPTTPTKGHIAFFYTTLAERIRLLADYFDTGLNEGDLCVLVTPGSTEQAVKDFAGAGLDVHAAVDEGKLRIFGMYQSYMPDGCFECSSMLSNVASFLKESQKLGFKNLRTAGEMRWINAYPGFLPSAAHYEDEVNGMDEFTGLCLYPIVPESEPILQAALLTHPTLIYDGRLANNAFEHTSIHAANDLNSFKALLAQA